MRYLRYLGLAACVAAVMCGAAASASAAVEFHSEANHTILTGSQTSTSVFSTNSGVVECEEHALSGTMENPTASEITAETERSNCSVSGSEATVNMNGCADILTLNNSGPPFAGPVDIECPGGQEIEISWLGGLCALFIPPQETGGVADYKNEGSGSTRQVTVVTTTEEVEYTSSGLCGTGSASNGEFSGSVQITGETTEGSHAGIWVE